MCPLHILQATLWGGSPGRLRARGFGYASSHFCRPAASIRPSPPTTSGEGVEDRTGQDAQTELLDGQGEEDFPYSLEAACKSALPIESCFPKISLPKNTLNIGLATMTLTATSRRFFCVFVKAAFAPGNCLAPIPCAQVRMLVHFFFAGVFPRRWRPWSSSTPRGSAALSRATCCGPWRWRRPAPCSWCQAEFGRRGEVQGVWVKRMSGGTHLEPDSPKFLVGWSMDAFDYSQRSSFW